jgi:hypothetical protein
MKYLLALFVLALLVPAVAFAQAAGVVVTDDPLAGFKTLVDLIASKQWPLAATMGVVILIGLARRYGGKYIPWLLTNRGGAVLSLLFAACESLVLALTSGAVGWVPVLTAAIGLFLKNMAVFTAFKKIVAPSGADKAQDVAVLAGAAGAKVQAVAGTSPQAAADALNRVGR